MNWTQEAKNLLNVFPSYVRFLASKKIENKNRNRNKNKVDKIDVFEIKKDEEIRRLIELDYEYNDIDYIQNLDMNICGGIRGCRFSEVNDREIVKIFYKTIKETKVLKIIEKGKKNNTTKHRKLKVAISGCPNSCTKPQIQDISVVGYVKPKLNKDKCISCLKCESECPLNIIDIKNKNKIDKKLCLGCRNCIRVCPTDALENGEKGYRILAGGRLGKVPKLANIYKEINNINQLEFELKKLINKFIYTIKNSKRFSDLVQ